MPSLRRGYLIGVLILLSSSPFASCFVPRLHEPLGLRTPTYNNGNCLSYTSHQRYRAPLPFARLLHSSASQQNGNQPHEDLESLQALFSKYCDSDGLMTKAAAMSVPSVAELLADDEILPQELDEIWKKAPKFPDAGNTEERVDVDSFVQIYRDIDDLFEDESEPVAASDMAGAEDEEEDNDKGDGQAMEAELEAIFKTICDKDSLLSFASVREWDEVHKLLEEGLLGQDELLDLWARTKKAPGSADQLDVDGFLSFNIELDGLFEFDDDEMNDDDSAASDTIEDESRPRAMVRGEDLPVGVLFSALGAQDGKVGKEDLVYWVEMQEMIAAGDLLESEAETLFEQAGNGNDRLNESEFSAFYDAIDNLFEDDQEEDAEDPTKLSSSQADLLKQELLETLKDYEDTDLLPCGLDLDDKEQKEILSIVSDLESQPTNMVRRKASSIQTRDLAGTWDLLYTSSSAMKFNRGLSGIGGSFPNGRFAGLTQTLKASKYLTDVEYLERIEVNPSSASFDVKVNGNWDLQTSTSLFTGEPSVVLTIVPDMVTYGPTSMRADHWKSLGPTNMLDISYLDDDLRIMRGNTAVDNIFIYRRSSQ